MASFEIDVRLSVAGGIVVENFGDAFGGATTWGLYDRFAFGLSPEPHQFHWQPFDGIAVKLRPLPPEVDPEVWEARNAWIESHGIPARVAELALRVAFICAAADGGPILRAQDLGPALAFAQYQVAARTTFAPNPGENPDARCAVMVRNWLGKNAGDKWVRRRDLDRGIHSIRLVLAFFSAA